LTLPASLSCLQSPNKTISYNSDKINRYSRLFARFSEIVQISVHLLDIFLTRHRNFFALFLQKKNTRGRLLSGAAGVLFERKVFMRSKKRWLSCDWLL